MSEVVGLSRLLESSALEVHLRVLASTDGHSLGPFGCRRQGVTLISSFFLHLKAVILSMVISTTLLLSDITFIGNAK